jgi:hypothetical protein
MAIFTRERTLAIRDLMNKTMDEAKEKLSARVYPKELIETIFRQITCRYFRISWTRYLNVSMKWTCKKICIILNWKKDPCNNVSMRL